MANALWITAIGMGLVFVAILLLWGLMALLVRLTAEKPAVLAGSVENPPEEPVLAGEHPVEALDAVRAKRQRAAAAGVALAMALRQQAKPARQAGSEGSRSAANLSAWQAVQRAGQLAAQRKGKQ